MVQNSFQGPVLCSDTHMGTSDALKAKQSRQAMHEMRLGHEQLTQRQRQRLKKQTSAYIVRGSQVLGKDPERQPLQPRV